MKFSCQLPAWNGCYRPSFTKQSCWTNQHEKCPRHLYDLEYATTAGWSSQQAPRQLPSERSRRVHPGDWDLLVPGRQNAQHQTDSTLCWSTVLGKRQTATKAQIIRAQKAITTQNDYTIHNMIIHGFTTMNTNDSNFQSTSPTWRRTSTTSLDAWALTWKTSLNPKRFTLSKINIETPSEPIQSLPKSPNKIRSPKSILAIQSPYWLHIFQDALLQLRGASPPRRCIHPPGTWPSQEAWPIDRAQHLVDWVGSKPFRCIVLLSLWPFLLASDCFEGFARLFWYIPVAPWNERLAIESAKDFFADSLLPIRWLILERNQCYNSLD